MGVIRPKPDTDSGETPCAKVARVKIETPPGASPASSTSGSSLVPRHGRHFTGASPGSSAGPPQCEGCKRIRGVSPDFILVGETVAWGKLAGAVGALIATRPGGRTSSMSMP